MPMSIGRRAARQVTRTIAIDGQQLRVCVRAPNAGRPRGGGRTPLLLLNGIGASIELLQPFVDELDPAVEVIRFDVPGVGGSPLPTLPYRFTGLCRLIAHLLSHLGYDAVDVLGISWGGGVAQHFAIRHRTMCRRLVLVSTATGTIMVPARPAVLAKMITPRRYTDPEYLRATAAELYGGSARTKPDQVRAMMHDQSRVGSQKGYLYQLMAGAGWTSLPFLPLIRQPTLIISGDDDPLIPLANARLMHALIPRSGLHVYSGGHVALVTDAQALTPIVDQFLAAADVELASGNRLARGPGQNGSASSARSGS
jgi:poly(3-hydroxyalkanoate) depolymerase